MKWTVIDPSGIIKLNPHLGLGMFNSEHEAYEYIKKLIRRFEIFVEMKTDGKMVGKKSLEQLMNELNAARNLVAVPLDS